MATVTGIGGVFFKAKDPKLLAEWYEKNLGINGMNWVVPLGGQTVFCPFPQGIYLSIYQSSNLIYVSNYSNLSRY
jgi:hypothetical protein